MIPTEVDVSDKFRRHKHTFGDSRWTSKYLVLLALLFSCVFMLSALPTYTYNISHRCTYTAP